MSSRTAANDEHTITDYEKDIDDYGLEQTWSNIIARIEAEETDLSGTLAEDKIGELYEIGLAYADKRIKKQQGKYFTPYDVARVMARWLKPLKGQNIADVCCGTGNLILAYLDEIGEESAKNLITSGRLWLYDSDALALRICLMLITKRYGIKSNEYINTVIGDFLDSDTMLPDNCKVISNPPYYKTTNISERWILTDVLRDTHELYAAIMEKIISTSTSSVIITPFSFIGGSKFHSMRISLNNHNGFIVSFDNIPGNIFNGKKHGTFNTNKTISVRAAITVTEDKKDIRGYRCTPMIRFRTDERERILDNEYLEKQLGKKYQIIDNVNRRYAKCRPELEQLLDTWNEASKGHSIDELLVKSSSNIIYFQNTCRYFTVATKRNTKRNGKIAIHIEDEKDIPYIYCLLNSSFCYWHWRLYDGGITYPVSLLHSIPDISGMLDAASMEKLKTISDEMINKESEFLTYKKNAGKMQESIKFPIGYRHRIDAIILELIGSDLTPETLDSIHSNSAFAD